MSNYTHITEETVMTTGLRDALEFGDIIGDALFPELMELAQPGRLPLDGTGWEIDKDGNTSWAQERIDDHRATCTMCDCEGVLADNWDGMITRNGEQIGNVPSYDTVLVANTAGNGEAICEDC